MADIKLMTKITSFNIQKDIIPKVSKPLLSFLSSARRLLVFFVSVKVSLKYDKKCSSYKTDSMNNLYQCFHCSKGHK